MSKTKNDSILESYPIGSIFITSSETSPSSMIGGSWERFGKGRVPVGVDENDINFNKINKIGGASVQSISVSNLPVHNHTVTNNKVTSEGISATPSIANTSLAHTHAGGGLNVTGILSIPYTHSDYYSSVGIGDHEIRDYGFPRYFSGGGAFSNSGGMSYNTDSVAHGFEFLNLQTGVVGAGSPYGSSNNIALSTANKWSGSSGSALGNHSHTINNAAHTHKVTSNVSIANQGSGTGHNNLQPYITCYMWKRTA